MAQRYLSGRVTIVNPKNVRCVALTVRIPRQFPPMHSAMKLREKIVASLREAAEIRGAEVTRHLTDDSVLLDSGLDSLGFAILVTKLEEELGYDPFVQLSAPVYPRTLGEFVEIYHRFAPAG